MSSPIPEATRAAVLADIRSRQYKRSEIAERHGIAASTVSAIAHRAGLPLGANPAPDPSPDRAAAAMLALEASREALQQLRQRLPDLTARELISFYAAAVDKHLALTGSTGGTDPGQARSLLQGLAQQLNNDASADSDAEPETTASDP